LLFELDCCDVDDVHLENRFHRLYIQSAIVTFHFQDLQSDVSAILWLSIIAQEDSAQTVISQPESLLSLGSNFTSHHREILGTGKGRQIVIGGIRQTMSALRLHYQAIVLDTCRPHSAVEYQQHTSTFASHASETFRSGVHSQTCN